MTEFFEIHDRDGAARIGEVRLADSLTTPALCGDVLADAGSLWPEDREAPTGDPGRLTVLPHRALPAGTPDEVAGAFAPEHPNIDAPSAAVVSTATAADHGTDAYALSDAQGVVGHASAFVEAIVGVRKAIPDDTALYLPGVATPANAALLAYAGVDLLDSDRAVVKGTQGKYLTTDGERFLEDLTELPCACPACQIERDEFDREDCATHNATVLEAELSTVRERIRRGRLRDYLEGQARHEGWLTAALRQFDQEYAYLEERTPVLRRSELLAASEETLRRAEIQRFAERVTTRYHNRFDNPLVLVPCSATKPYSESQSHEQFHSAIGFRAHTVSMTSPIGVVPQELECTYPAQHYDSVVTGEWTAGEREFVASVLEAYLERNEYSRVIAHVPADYRPITERVEDALGIEFTYTVADHPTTTDSLAALDDALDGELKYAKRERQHNTVRAIADYQFGPRAGDALFESITTESFYPKLRVRRGDDHLATMVPQYGTLALTLAGARRWVESDAPTKRVTIDGFVPHGSVLAPGIVDADDAIRVGDEVVVEGPRAFAVGRAAMHGSAMAEGTRGVAVTVRHVEER
ncbi:archaeosine synthase subunit alpha [Halococcus saccharolyticus]|uniref:tRNA-guanine transglycosylase n=1 Tax=Halococcus saccharolyticus DSM 5350 TaxID=1227455 RepID=M0MLY7_9EURY|nr:archaeosine synthase subunit alpha [Halococcus saccharolyticus]EMA46702.1 tRNA-guanine transglycosylase [Halococcus saccharolyticus DSM 5350]